MNQQVAEERINLPVDLAQKRCEEETCCSSSRINKWGEERINLSVDLA